MIPNPFTILFCSDSEAAPSAAPMIDPRVFNSIAQPRLWGSIQGRFLCNVSAAAAHSLYFFCLTHFVSSCLSLFVLLLLIVIFCLCFRCENCTAGATAALNIPGSPEHVPGALMQKDNPFPFAAFQNRHWVSQLHHYVCSTASSCLLLNLEVRACIVKLRQQFPLIVCYFLSMLIYFAGFN